MHPAGDGNEAFTRLCTSLCQQQQHGTAARGTWTTAASVRWAEVQGTCTCGGCTPHRPGRSCLQQPAWPRALGSSCIKRVCSGAGTCEQSAGCEQS